LAYLIETEDVYDDMIQDYQHYDFSAYAKDSDVMKKIATLPDNIQQEIKNNTKAFGKFKDEQAKDPMIEYCGRAPKEYSYQTASDSVSMKGKGVPGNILKNQCSHANAVKMVLSMQDHAKHSKETFQCRVKFRGFRTLKHTIYTEQREKTGMSVLDSKRYVCSDGITTLAFGHPKIPTL
jgi:hypothetical protein